ncbi:hypothetical protein AX16_003205 [Volvariella volvacea WC 439]|nr:hypothetical protein AX16_003205 [Volvariella volvacea WC 439]
MTTPAPFSRLQLAAALLEYDNDPDNPDAPYRSAQESAIFLPLRRIAASRPPRKSDYLGVSIPSETGSHGGRESMMDNRRSRISRASFDALRNPFGPDDTIASEDEEGGDMEVDLASWGLEAFIPKDKEHRNSKGKGKAPSAPQAPHPMSSVRSHKPFTNNDTDAPKRVLGSRSLSVGNMDFQTLNPDDSIAFQIDRRRSFGSPLDLAGVVPGEDLARRQPALNMQSEHPESVPFPTTSIRSPSPAIGGLPREHALSTGSRDSRAMLQGDTSHHDPAVPPDDNPFAVRPPSRGSRFDPKAMLHARTMSNASMGSKMLGENDRHSVMTGPAPTNRDPRYSTTLELLRPKVLVMPSPLQSANQSAPEPQANVREGFQLSTDGPPLPPGARTGRRLSNNLLDGTSAPSASNLFTPNPTMSLSLSQMTFRNTLAVGGQADGPGLPRALNEGEQAKLEDDDPEPVAEPSPQPLLDESGKVIRPAGKLYGKSLIDDLEARKAQMRSKQRVFTGDQRPSMMARSSTARASTLIDPATLQSRPKSSFGIPESQSGPGLARRNSTLKPLLNFDDEQPLSRPINARPPQSRSVFGVDTLWEREMAKLREIEAQEKLEEEERKRREEELETKKSKKKKKGKKNGTPETIPPSQEPTTSTPEVAEPHVSADPPVLPQIPKAVRRPPPPPAGDDEEESESNDEEPAPTNNKEPANWYAGSSDEERDPSGPRRTTGTGPRYPANTPRRAQPPPGDSDDDVPLSVAARGTMQRNLQPPDADSDEEKPLSALLEKTKLNIPPIDFDGPLSATRSDDEDDQPLGLRASRVFPQASTGEDDDDRPLALHPEQQRRTQYQMMAQQQLMMQAQFQNSMFFTPPIMAPGFYGPPVMPQMMMQPPMQIPSPPPMHDEAKFGRVDKWRRDVAVDSEP